VVHRHGEIVTVGPESGVDGHDPGVVHEDVERGPPVVGFAHCAADVLEGLEIEKESLGG
jgi:hypothetical protein